MKNPYIKLTPDDVETLEKMINEDKGDIVIKQKKDGFDIIRTSQKIIKRIKLNPDTSV